MTFDDFVEAVDAAVRAATAVHYGLYRGPAVAYWQHPSGTARLRDGVRDDVELDVDEGGSDALIGSRSAATAGRFAAAILAAWDAPVSAR